MLTAAGSSSLGGLFGASKPEEKKDAPAAAPSLGGLFGASKTDTPAAGSALSAFGALKSDAAGGIAKAPSIGGDKPAGMCSLSYSSCITSLMALFVPGFTALGGGASSTAAPAVAVAPPSVLRGKTIEDIVNKWSSDLETHVREFNKFAGEVAVWDRALIENGNNVSDHFTPIAVFLDVVLTIYMCCCSWPRCIATCWLLSGNKTTLTSPLTILSSNRKISAPHWTHTRK